jgi:hypothetical protein
MYRSDLNFATDTSTGLIRRLVNEEPTGSERLVFLLLLPAVRRDGVSRGTAPR